MKPGVIRAVGWGGLLVGGAVYLFGGADLTNRENLVPWIGVFLMLLSMVITSSASLVAQIQRMRNPRKPDPP